MAMLEVKNLGISFGGLRAVDDFHISIEKGQLYGLIGPNGAGKTTIFNLLTGVYKPDTGTILLLRGLNNYRMLIYAIVLIVVMIFNQSPEMIALRKRLTARFRKEDAEGKGAKDKEKKGVA